MLYILGDLFKSIPKNKHVLIPHVCNDIHLMGKGFVIPLCMRWPHVKKEYVAGQPPLGTTQFVEAEKNDIFRVVVANMVAQHETIRTIRRPIRYEALVGCMSQVRDFCLKNDFDIICPKFGSGNAGGNWHFIEELIEEIWEGKGIFVTVHEV